MTESVEISGQYSYSLDDYWLAAAALGRPNSYWRKVLSYAVWTAVFSLIEFAGLALASHFAFDSGAQHPLLPQVLRHFGVALVEAGLALTFAYALINNYLIVPYWTFRRTGIAGATISFRLSDGQMAWTTPEYEVKVPWSSVERVLVSGKDIVMVFSSRGTMVLPSRAFASPADREMAAALIGRAVRTAS